MLNRFLGIITVVTLLLGGASFSLAASVSIIPSGGGRYIVQGNGMDGIAGVDLIIRYSAPLSNPSVSQGGALSGAMFAANPNYAPGSIKIAVISANSLSGSGEIAVIRFASWRENAPIPTVTASFIDSKGAAVSGTTPGFSDSPGIPFSQPETPAAAQQTTQQQTTQQETTPQQTTATPSSAGLGGVTMAPDPFLKSDTKAAEPAAPPADIPAATAAPATPPEQPATQRPEEPKRPEEARTTVYSAVLERFRAYQGEKSPAILAALFKKDVAPTIRQEPPVALSDGTRIRIIAALPSPNGKSPNFALNGATQVSLKKGDEAGTWIIEALPRENVLQATLTILNGAEIIEYPLTVAPPLKTGAIGEAAFNAFLKNSGKGGDLNNDGRRDFTDEYIYTANYLVRMNQQKAPGK